jgi:hypothetical protein
MASGPGDDLVSPLPRIGVSQAGLLLRGASIRTFYFLQSSTSLSTINYTAFYIDGQRSRLLFTPELTHATTQNEHNLNHFGCF